MGGSSEVQIALFTARIKHITDHVISNPKDHAWDTEESGDEDLLAGFDLENADVGDIKEWSVTPREICVEERAAAKAAHARHDTDCGSSEVQIALFTARIKHITDHVISN